MEGKECPEVKKGPWTNCTGTTQNFLAAFIAAMDDGPDVSHCGVGLAVNGPCSPTRRDSMESSCDVSADASVAGVFYVRAPVLGGSPCPVGKGEMAWMDEGRLERESFVASSLLVLTTREDMDSFVKLEEELLAMTEAQQQEFTPPSARTAYSDSTMEGALLVKTFQPSPLQPRKAKKKPVPDVFKDERYWDRRRRNNAAAKKSRDTRRMRENRNVARISFLEHEVS
ncbi:unnamed protein product [Darwinula stevensoni]|uniref:BZIP domain-containing protein n=1 Tax=Darwinula stevensoni TaxID=69355 RepID=A0A7R9A5V2_9CRUS|nr:unnamed protein product [Darwinula stevensoni]CAG0886053.1 unnamed protein product [Darwinula stevensoni]